MVPSHADWRVVLLRTPAQHGIKSPMVRRLRCKLDVVCTNLSLLVTLVLVRRGRNMECPGEDPYVTSVYAREYVRAMQGEHPSGILKTVCTPKHFTGQMFEGDGSNPWNNGTTGCELRILASSTMPTTSNLSLNSGVVNRQSNDTRYPLHDLEKYYLPAFRAAMVDAKAGSVMCAYQVRILPALQDVTDQSIDYYRQLARV